MHDTLMKPKRPNQSNSSVFLIAGPTASGKSAAAMALAEETGGWIVNADSMQVYDQWRVLTARPSVEDEATLPHRLYGHRPVAEWYSVGDWLRELAALREMAGSTPLIIVGGTGLYFRAATMGLAPIPAIPAEIREAADTKLQNIGDAAFKAALLRIDPRAIEMDIDNPRRMLRAWEVITATGRSLISWAEEPTKPLLSEADILFQAILSPERDLLAARIARRFETMLDQGALAEVVAISALALDPSLPAMRAIGYRQLAAFIAGEISREAAIERAVIETRQYAKRQRTWFRNQLGDWPEFPEGGALLSAAHTAITDRR